MNINIVWKLAGYSSNVQNINRSIMVIMAGVSPLCESGLTGKCVNLVHIIPIQRYLKN